MRTILLVAFFAFLATSYGVHIANYRYREERTSLLKHGFTIGSRYVIQPLPAGDGSSEAHHDYAIDTLQRARVEILALLQQAQGALNQENSEYDAAHQAAQNKVNDIQTQITNAQSALTQASNSAADIQAALQASQLALTNAQNAYSVEQTRRAGAKADYEAALKDLSDALATCDEAIALLRQLQQGGTLPPVGLSLLEITKETSEKKAGHLKSTVKKANKHIPESLISTLAEVATGTTTDPKTLNTIIGLIQQLRASLQAEFDSNTAANAKDAQDSAALLASLQNTINTENQNIQNNGNALNSANGIIIL